MNRYPRWLNYLVLFVILAGTLLALPNVFGVDSGVHISRADANPFQDATLSQMRTILDEEGIGFISAAIEDNAGLIRFANEVDQQRANAVLRERLPNYVIALTLAPRTPGWLNALGLEPMNLGLDLRGGVHFLYQVDLDSAVQQFLGSYEASLRTQLREAGIRNRVRVEGDALIVPIIDGGDLDQVEQMIRGLDAASLQLVDRLIVDRVDFDEGPGFRVQLAETLLRERQDFAIQQNTTTLRNRVDELGVAEPVVQRQGLDRILIQLPGVQDPAQAERILGATATLEFRLVDTENNAFDAQERGRAPLGSALYQDPGGLPVLLRREVIVSGDQITDATSGYSQGQPAVFVNLDSRGADRMLDTTAQNLGRPMAVLFIEETPELVERNGEEVIETRTDQTVINQATIQGVFSSRFQITGLTPFEAQDLALLLRAGALATPIFKIEERTIGPSLGQDNINKGRLAIIVGFLAVVAFMAVYYRIFGLVANLALFANLVLIVALLSLLQAALTLPGIAGIVLTVGMAVDANVLIFERIREELRNGNSPQASIRAGYEKAFSTIADANITTLIAATVLFSLGTGAIKGFAVTLGLGILTSMFTAIIGTRTVVNLIYGGRQQVQRLAIGGNV
ncbi:protein translocase subunit SecD [Candidatus Rariloculus sp.]|uniref:protein translocase subunit SecD n=1 Tax=Candidatus Rariloculus sp. TaxID=3101265 RepID=UPI003D0DFE81